jgi:hypothetical protein
MQTSNADFGVTLLLLNCAFSAEVRRDVLEEVLADIEAQLTASGAPDDDDTRVEWMLGNINEVSAMVANAEIEHEEGVADIAYSFIYCLGKTLGFDQVVNLRGLTGSYFCNKLHLNPCLGEIEYNREMAVLQRAMEESPDDWAGLLFQPTPTIH